MGKVYGVHTLHFKPDANIAEFEQFFRQMVATPQISGMQAHLLQADRGEGAGQYLLLWEIDSVETRDKLFPVAGDLEKVDPEALKGFEAVAQAWGKWVEDTPDAYTDWVTLV